MIGKFHQKAKIVLLVLAALAAAAGLTVGYWYLLEAEVAGYRGVKEYQLERNREREQRRKMIPGVPAVRERMLKKEFGDLPEAADVRTDIQFLRIWERLLNAMFAVFAIGSGAYVIFGRRKSWRRRVAVSIFMLAGVSQVLPMLLLPTDALKFFHRYGLWVILVAGLYLLVEVLRDRLSARRSATTRISTSG